MLPLFLLMKNFHLINTYWGVIIPGMASIFGIFLIRQYALSIPDDMLDAARIDGAFGAAHLLVGGRAGNSADSGDARDLDFSGDVERLHVAVDRAER